MPRRPAVAANLLEMVPEREVEWTTGKDDLVRIQVPRYGSSRLGVWFGAWLGRPHIFVKLDDIGSEIWRSIDGGVTVGDIGDRLEAKFGERVRPVPERLAKFFGQLERSRWIRWR